MYLSEYGQFVGSADRTIRPQDVQAEMLDTITYPTGGYTAFEYESNDYSSQGTSYAADQNPMTQSTTPPEDYDFNYYRESGFDTDPATLSFTLTQQTHVHVKYSCSADGANVEWSNPGDYEYDYQLQAGTYTDASLLNTSLLTTSGSDNITSVHAFVTVYWADKLVPIDAKVGPGLRIKSITTNDGITSTTRSFEYKLNDSSTVSSGFLSVFPAFYGLLQNIALNMSGYYITSDPINDIGDGAPVGYRRVVERFQDNSYIVHNFTSYEDYPDETMEFTNGFSDPELAHMSSNDFWRGLETNTDYYNSAGILQKAISNDYDTLPGSLTDVQCIEVKPTVGIITSPGGSVNNINATINSLYYVHSCFLYNTARYETTYDKSGQNPITTIVFKDYDNVKHLQPTRVETDKSDGSVLITTTSFPDDYAAGTPFIDYMQASHLTSFPVEQVVYKQKAGVNNIVSGNIITYKTTGAGLPDQLFKLTTTSPIPQASFKFSNRVMGVLPPSGTPSQFSADTHYQPVLTYTQYDNRGNPLESVGRNGITTSYLWGYKQEFPVAQIVGTGYSTAISKITDPSILDNPATDADLRTQLNSLRSITGALVTTYSYAPLTGVTSETDPNGRTTYYEYDPFNRLSVIRDKDQNILKKICYNYSGQPGLCNVYQSDAINTDYYSNTCPSGQSGVAYHVSVPQGKFTSFVDQATANLLAQQYAQNQANANGSCQIAIISLYGDDEVGTNFSVTLHNVSSGQNYSFTVYAHNADTMGDVPYGTYDISLTPNSSTGWFNYSVGCGYYDEGPGGSTITLYGVPISSECNTIEID
jgi:YD repeat-containing protein